ncbi:MAG TPA: tyrosine--tRNA ligase [Candidatus Solibacter sp.]|jgi:tyrosyl-tRNA synthetase|nr:tyrosine--tRNA ligase [Candidatus Solibacter sp.]
MSDWEKVVRGAAHIEVEDHLREALASGRKLRVKLGIDPSSPDIHLGHTVVLGKLRDFQELGHTAVLIIGDFTARIGDPSGQNATRRPLEVEEVEANAKTYLDQVFRVLDPDATEVRHQSEWFEGMSVADVIRVAGRATLAQITTRDDFRQRLESNSPIGLHELLYPLLQGYDSVAVAADVELGGTDQLFNLLFARDVQRESGMPPQDVLTTPLLEGLDGVQKMSKSLGNYVGVSDPPAEMFGKLMSVPDQLIARYFLLVVGSSEAEMAEVQRRLDAGENPRDLKAELARTIVTRFHSTEDATAAGAAFTAQFRHGQRPEQIENRTLDGGTTTVADALVALGLASSKGEARRLASQRGVKLNDGPVENADTEYNPSEGDVWQVGKRRYIRVTRS